MTWIRSRFEYPVGPRYAIKVALAAGLATLVVQVFDLSYPFFAPLSAIIVIDTTARANPALARARLIGAVGGGALGYLAALVAPDDWWSVTLVVVLVVLMGIGLRLGAATRQMAVVAAVVVMVPVGTDLGRYATTRVVETAIGVAAALLVSRFVWPPHIAAETRARFATLFEHFEDLYDAIVSSHAGPGEQHRIPGLEQQVLTDVHDINDDWDAAMAERPARDVLPPELQVVSRRIRSSLSGMNAALRRRPSTDDRLAPLAEPIGHLTAATSRVLAATAAALHRPQAPFPDVTELEECVTALLAAAVHLDGPGGVDGPGPDAVLAEFTYVFMLREIAGRLVDLADPGVAVPTTASLTD